MDYAYLYVLHIRNEPPCQQKDVVLFAGNGRASLGRRIEGYR